MVVVKDTVRGKKGSGVTPTRNIGVSIGHTDATPSRRKNAKAVAASIRRKLIPTRTSRGKPQAFLEPVQTFHEQQQYDVQA